MISYKPLMKLMIDRNIRKGNLREQANLSTATLAKLSNDEKVSLDIIDKLCRTLEVQPGDIIEYIPDKKD